MQTFAEIINLWPSAAALAADLGLSPVRVRAWRNRPRGIGSIPKEWWKPVVDCAERRGIEGVTFAALAHIACAPSNGDDERSAA